MREHVFAGLRASRLAGGGSRHAAALLVLVGVLTAGCALPAPHAQHPGARPTDSPAPTDSPTPTVAGSTGTAAPSAATDPAVAHPAGASAQVSRIVIMQQLARRAERIAKHTPLPPRPSDVDPGSNRALGYQMMLEFGFPADQWPYLDALWRRESGWNHLAENRSSGAYGIPQSLPAEKMAVVGPDWRTNPQTQIEWGLAYIAARYSSPQQAWAHSEKLGWY